MSPLIGRLQRIFDLTEKEIRGAMGMEISRRFLRPIFKRGTAYPDSLPVLQELRRLGKRTGILSNSPWGSPPALWREELERHGLLNAVDAVVFCGDVGYRKPAPQPFERIMEELAVSAEQCLFVGDDPRWDIEGPRRLGMAALLIDRQATDVSQAAGTIRDLTELLPYVSATTPSPKGSSATTP